MAMWVVGYVPEVMCSFSGNGGHCSERMARMAILALPVALVPGQHPLRG